MNSNSEEQSLRQIPKRLVAVMSLTEANVRVLKALAFHHRGENKDAYDLFYLLRNYGQGVADVATELRPLLSDASAQKAMEYLRSDFNDADSTGPRRAAEFLFGQPDAATQADAVGFVQRLLVECKL